MLKTSIRKRIVSFTICSILIISICFLSVEGYHFTSTNKYCISCHVHHDADVSYLKSVHYGSSDSLHAKCVDCHLPPRGSINHLFQKCKSGVKDLIYYHLKDSAEFDWLTKSNLQSAKQHTYVESCMKCHDNLFTANQSKMADQAHLYYSYNKSKLNCLNCHLNVGHFTKSKKTLSQMFNEIDNVDTIYTSSPLLEDFVSFRETIPQTSVSFDMVAIAGGDFVIGSELDSKYAERDEFPRKRVFVDSIFIGRVEVTWDEYLQFMRETETEGRDDVSLVSVNKNVDAISGATPPWGDPSQGWGMGARPAITMTHYAAVNYCKWLSHRTRKTYRLPTEAEWEYCARAGTEDDYFFGGEVNDYIKKNVIESLFSSRDKKIDKYVNSRFNCTTTMLPSSVLPNQYGLVNMLGNVREFCSDSYSSKFYSKISNNDKNPKMKVRSKEFVIRGGSFLSLPKDLRVSNRDFTKHDKWLMTDPQIPKSVWWYSDCFDVGFRVVCEF